MQPVRYNQILRQIANRLEFPRLSETIHEIVLSNFGTNRALPDTVRTGAIGLLQRLLVELDSVQKDSDMSAVWNLWSGNDFVSVDFLAQFLANLRVHGHTGPFNSPAETAKYATVHTFIQAFNTNIRVNDEVLHVGRLRRLDEEVIVFQLLSEDEDPPSLEHVTETLTEIRRLIGYVQQLYQLAQESVDIVYLETGSDIALRVKVGAAVTAFLLGVATLISENIHYAALQTADRPHQLATLLAVNRELDLQVQKGDLDEERVKLLRGKVIEEIDKLYSLNVVIDDKRSTPTSLRRLLQYKKAHELPPGATEN
ncbi:MAG: hypothetical protein JSS75_00060 [Bacteroidetes bacterium]|nr:hypothetical protein [Bacteroidota bacterium]